MKKEIVLFWLISLSVFGFLFSFGFPLPVDAGVQVTPTITQLNLPADGEKSDFFSVLNDGDKLIGVEVELEELFKSQINSGDISVESWLEIEPKKFDISPGEVKKVKYKVRVPPAREGELRAEIFFVTQEPSVGGMGIKNRFGVAMYVTIKGTEVVEAQITDVSITGINSELEKDFEGIRVGVTVQNKGNVHLRPQGKVIIKDAEGETLKELPLPYGYPIMPGTEHTYFTFWKDVEALLPGSYKVSAFIQYGDIYNLNKRYDFQTTYFFK